MLLEIASEKRQPFSVDPNGIGTWKMADILLTISYLFIFNIIDFH